MKKILYVVINDVVYDRRIQRICEHLVAIGNKVYVVGFRKKEEPQVLTTFSFPFTLLSVFFKKGKLFYIEANIRILLYLIFKERYDIYVSADIDTGLGVYFASCIKGGKYGLDLHEIFPELPETSKRPLVKLIWYLIEKFLLKKAKIKLTISDSFASYYGISSFFVIKNVPYKSNYIVCDERTYVLYQGSVNEGRGFNEILKAFSILDVPFVICGKGNYYSKVQEIIRKKGLEGRVFLKGWISPTILHEFTKKAKIGLTIFDASGLSNFYSLANRFFDYINYLVPQVAMNYPEYRKINSKYEVAILLDNLTPDNIALAIKILWNDHKYYDYLVSNCLKAREEFCWEVEKQKLSYIFI